MKKGGEKIKFRDEMVPRVDAEVMKLHCEAVIQEEAAIEHRFCAVIEEKS